MVRNSLTRAFLYSLSMPSSLTAVLLTSFPLGLCLTPDNPLSGPAAGALLCTPADAWSQGDELLFSEEKLAEREEASGGWWILVGGVGRLYSGILLSLGEIQFVMNPFMHAFIHSASVS